MKRTLLIGVAVGALLAGSHIASAQMMERGGAGAAAGQGGGATVQQGGAAERSGGSVEQRGRAGGEIKANSPAGNVRAQGQAQGDIKATTGQGQKAEDAQKGDNRAQSRDKAEDNRARDNKAQRVQSDDAAKGGASTQDGDKAKGSAAAQGGGKNAGASKTLTTEQKTRIRETVIRSSNAPRVTNVNFSISVGTVVPRTVRYAPLPPVLVEYYPSWRGYDYIIVSEQIIIIEPGTLRIVAILDV